MNSATTYRFAIGTLLFLSLAACRSQKSVATRPVAPISTNAFLSDPLGVPRNVRGLTGFFRGKRPSVTPHPNRHNPEQIDSLYRWKGYGLLCDLLKTATGSHFLIQANISNGKYALRNGICVGMTYEEVAARIANLPKLDANRSVALSSSERPIAVRLFFSSANRLRRILISEFVD